MKPLTIPDKQYYDDANFYSGVLAPSKQPIQYIDLAPTPIKIQIPLVEFFERIKRVRADKWQVHFCNHLQDIVVNRHVKGSFDEYHAEPQIGKTSILSQAFKAWCYGHDPFWRAVLAMYNISRSEAHSEVIIQIMRSQVYREIFPNKASHLPNTLSKSAWNTNARMDVEQGRTDGQKSFTAVGLQSGITGSSADWYTIDDPYKDPGEAWSEAVRTNLDRFWKYGIEPRLTPFSCIAAMFHRYSYDDFGGYLLNTGQFNYVRYATVADGDYVHDETGQSFPDPIGRKEGEYISERRPPSYYVDKRKDPRVWNSMFQGRPSSQEGDFFRVGKMQMVAGDELAAERAKCVLWVRAWDNAATEGGGDHTAGAKMGIRSDGGILIDNMKLAQVEASKRLELQKATAMVDGIDVPVCIPRELAEAGKSLVFLTEEHLRGFTVVSRSVSNSTTPGSTAKARRAYNFSIAVNSGQVKYTSDADLPEDEKWNKTVLRAMRNFLFSDFDDPCFIAGTLIKTLEGEKPIELVTNQDLVLTRSGFKSVLWAGMTKRKAAVSTLLLSNSKTLIGTPNHPIFIRKKGFVRLDSITDGDILISWQNQSVLSLTALSFIAILCQSERLIGDIFSLARTMASHYTKKSGAFIMEKSQQVFMSIIKMGILLITIFPTSNFSVRQNTIKSTVPNPLFAANHQSNWPFLNVFGLLLRSGTAAMKGENGIAATRRKYLPTESRNPSSASFAENLFNLKGCSDQSDGFVTTIAPQSSAVKKSAKRFLRTVKYVLKNFWRCRKFSLVPVNAVRVEGGTEQKPVYNLHVQDVQEYFANGVLVHNCDAMGDGYNHLYETLIKGLLITNYKPQRNLFPYSGFVEMFPFGANGMRGVLKIPAAFTTYIGVKISADASFPTSAVITARASEHAGLGETVFVIAEYKAYDGSVYKLFEWLKTTLATYCEKPDMSNTSVWLHPDSEQFDLTIIQKLGIGIRHFKGDKELGFAELNWYFMPTQAAHPTNRLENASRLYALVPDKQFDAPTDEQGLPSLRQELATCGYNEKGEPAATVAVLDCLRMCVAQYRTMATPRTDSERIEAALPPELRMANLLKKSPHKKALTDAQQFARSLAEQEVKERLNIQDPEDDFTDLY